MNDEIIPKNTRELFLYMRGEFKSINNKLRLVFWIGGLSGTIFASLVLGIFKFIGWVK